MGIYDREYYRDDQTKGVQLQAPQSMVMRLIIITFGFWLANLFFGGDSDWIMDGMAASAKSLTEPWNLWQLLSSGFAHSPQRIQHILFNMLGLWVFGRELEGIYGKFEFLRIYLVSIVLGSLFFAVGQLIFLPATSWGGVIGASGAISTLVVLFIMRFPHRTLLVFFVLPMPAWVFGLVFLAINILGAGGIYIAIGPNAENAKYTAYSVHLVGAAFGFLYFHFRWNLGRFIPGGGGSPAKWLKRKPKLRVHDPDPAADEAYSDLDREGDRILSKIDREGMESLTAKEQRILEDYSRRMRQKHR